MFSLYCNIKKKKFDEFKMLAMLHGVDLKDTQSGSSPSNSALEPEVPLFGDPDSYKHLSDAEKNSLTEKMMKGHKNWASNILG